MVGEIVCSGGEIVLVDDADFCHLANFNWRMDRRNIAVRFDGKKYVSIFREVYCRMEPNSSAERVSAAGGDYFNATRLNITTGSGKDTKSRREATARKCGPNRQNTTGFKGVSVHASGMRWVAEFQKKHRSHHDTPELAARAYDDAAFAVWGTDCYLNFPENYGLPPRGETP